VTIVNGYSDGIDPDSCRHVRIANCRIDAWDDAIVPKASFSLGTCRAVEYLTVTNCDLASNRNTFKLGTESGGGFRHIAVSNCVMHARTTGGPPVSGISLESVDGGDIDGVTISNISMVNVRAPLFLRLGNRGRDQAVPTPGTLRNVVINNIVATGASLACPVAGIPGHVVHDVTLDNIQITFAGGGTLEQASVQVPECEDKYPQASMFGVLPAYGVYCRHVEGLRLRDIRLSLQASDHRPALVCDDVARVLIDSWEADRSEDAAATIRFRGVRKALIGNCLLPESTSSFIQVMDGAASEITFQGNGK
jgi:hypothetical protein